MLAKMWKKIGLIILLIFCVFNIMTKFVGRVSFLDQIKNAAVYIQYSVTQ